MSDPPRAYRCLKVVCAACSGALVLRNVVFPALVFEGLAADLYAFAFCSAVAVFTCGTAHATRSGREVETRASRRDHSAASYARLTGAIWVVTLALAAYCAPVALARADWSSLLQRLSVFPVWLTVFALCRRLSAPTPARPYAPPLLLALLVLCVAGYKTLALAGTRLSDLTSHRAPAADLLLSRYADYDISFAVARALLATVDAGPRNSAEDEAFYDFLRRSTLIPASVPVAPAPLKLAADLAPTAGAKPNIFIFVIDSLRPDYLSPYNPAVTFTPAIGQFARESVVLENAFTRYGGTALSEPAIWTGTLQLHKQYVQPFHPMNNLQRLIEAEGYKPYLNLDSISRVLVRPSPDIETLDQNPVWFKYDFAAELAELEAKLDARGDKARPVFAYAQPQNLHLVSLRMNPATEPPPDALPPGMDRRHAAEVARVDRAFGQFIQFLRARNLYENSIVVLLNDHGDSLGEEGHWGHTASIYPEVMRAPLIMHLPARLRRSLVCDTRQIAFASDITPTLYYLLGHTALTHDELAGRPLCAATSAELAAYARDSYLVAGSYSPAYGLLRDNGRTLFIADAQQRRDFYYDLSTGFAGTHRPLTDQERADNHRLIQEAVERINRHYHFQP